MGTVDLSDPGYETREDGTRCGTSANSGNLRVLPEMWEPSPAGGQRAQRMLPWEAIRHSASPSQMGFYSTRHLPGPVP